MRNAWRTSITHPTIPLTPVGIARSTTHHRCERSGSGDPLQAWTPAPRGSGRR
jgi:hypothetical protein